MNITTTPISYFAIVAKPILKKEDNRKYSKFHAISAKDGFTSLVPTSKTQISKTLIAMVVNKITFIKRVSICLSSLKKWEKSKHQEKYVNRPYNF